MLCEDAPELVPAAPEVLAPPAPPDDAPAPPPDPDGLVVPAPEVLPPEPPPLAPPADPPPVWAMAAKLKDKAAAATVVRNATRMFVPSHT